MKTDTPRTDEAWAAWPYAGSGMSVHVGRQLERELAAVTEQRDRLAEAIRKHKATYPFAPDFCDVELYEALAAVEGGSHE